MRTGARLIIHIILISTLVHISAPSSQAATLSGCLMIANPKATISGQQISISADIYQTCKSYSSGSGSLSVLELSPVYSVNLLGVMCTGPQLKSELISLPSLGYVLGNMRCSGTTTSYGRSSSVLSASTANGTVSTEFGHILISNSVVQKPIQNTPIQNTPIQNTPIQTVPRQTNPAQTISADVESPETTIALQGLETANQEVLEVINFANLAEIKASKFNESLTNLMTTVQYLINSAKERIANLLELVKRLQTKSN